MQKETIFLILIGFIAGFAEIIYFDSIHNLFCYYECSTSICDKIPNVLIAEYIRLSSLMGSSDSECVNFQPAFVNFIQLENSSYPQTWIGRSTREYFLALNSSFGIMESRPFYFLMGKYNFDDFAGFTRYLNQNVPVDNEIFVFYILLFITFGTFLFSVYQTLIWSYACIKEFPGLDIIGISLLSGMLYNTTCLTSMIFRQLFSSG